MKKYIDSKSEKIINAKTDFEETLLQINEQQCLWQSNGNNQSIEKRINLRLVNNMKDYLKYMRKSIFISQ